MKLSSLLLAGSLVANVAIGGWIFFATQSESDSSTLSVSAAEGAAAGGSHQPATSSLSANDASLWSKVQTENTATMIARLRAAGFPVAVIRAIVGERLRAQFAERRKAIIGAAAPFEYWKPSGNYNNGYSSDPKLRSQLRDLNREQTQAMKALLGPDAADDSFVDPYMKQQYGNMPKEKRDQVMQITQDYSDLSSQITNAANGMMLKEDRDKLAYLENERRADLAAVLSPEEIADYEMRSSNTTNRLRYQLANLDLTEEQFRAIYAVQKPFDDKFSLNPGGITSADQVRARNDAQKQATAEIKAALGEPLGIQYEQALDQNYQSASRVVSRLNLPATTTQQVVDVQKEIEQRATALRKDASLSPEQRDLQLGAIQQEASSRLTNALGVTGLKVYRENGGYWLDNLKPSRP